LVFHHNAKKLSSSNEKSVISHFGSREEEENKKDADIQFQETSFLIIIEDE
jgi:hypothetical protein